MVAKVLLSVVCVIFKYNLEVQLYVSHVPLTQPHFGP